MSSVIATPAIDSAEFLTRFVHNAHRRWKFQHFIECAALGGTISIATSTIAYLLLTPHIFGSSRAFEVLASAGYFTGALVAAATAPSTIAVLTHVDSILGNDQLLSSAWRSLGTTNRWDQLIVSLAAQRCGESRPSQLVPKKINSRGWSWIAVIAVAAGSARALNLKHPSAIAAISRTAPPDESWTSWVSKSNLKFPTAISTSTVDPGGEIKAETPETLAAPNPDTPSASLGLAKAPGQNAGKSSTDGAGAGIASDTRKLIPLPDWTRLADSADSLARDSTAASQRTEGQHSGAGASSARAPHASAGDGTIAAATDNFAAWGQFNAGSIDPPDNSDSSDVDLADRYPPPYRNLARDFYVRRSPPLAR